MNARLPTSSDVVFLIERAALAPSSHNTQPWRFRITGATVDLFAEPTRVRDVASRSVPRWCYGRASRSTSPLPRHAAP